MALAQEGLGISRRRGADVAALGVRDRYQSAAFGEADHLRERRHTFQAAGLEKSQLRFDRDYELGAGLDDVAAKTRQAGVRGDAGRTRPVELWIDAQNQGAALLVLRSAAPVGAVHGAIIPARAA